LADLFFSLLNELKKTNMQLESERDELKSALEATEIALKQSGTSLSMAQMKADKAKHELQLLLSKKRRGAE
jgi:hypothetical protein